MKKPVIVDANDLLCQAQWIEARGDPMQTAQEIRALVAAAKPPPAPADDRELVADMKLEISSFGQCRGRVHGDPKKPCECRYCRIIKRIAQ